MAAACSVRDAVVRLEHGDASFKKLWLDDQGYGDAELAPLLDALLARPNALTHLSVGDAALYKNRLTDASGTKLAAVLASSTTIEYLALSNNCLADATYLAVAAALHANSSLRELYLWGNRPVDRAHCDRAFSAALRVNANRPPDSNWWLYTTNNDFERLQL